MQDVYAGDAERGSRHRIVRRRKRNCSRPAHFAPGTVQGAARRQSVIDGAAIETRCAGQSYLLISSRAHGRRVVFRNHNYLKIIAGG